MKKKGFTLVELLAVIAVLAILVIMALPAVLKMYNKARIDSFSNEVNIVIRTARQQYLLDGGGNQTYTNTSGSKSLNLSGPSKLKYYVEMNDQGKITKLQATNGSYQYNKSGIIDIADRDDIQIISELTESEIVLNNSSGIIFVNRQNEGSITIGDEVSIGGEHFYVINTNSSNTELFAKYNLLVGNNYNWHFGNFDFIKTLSSSDSGYGLQNQNAQFVFNDTFTDGTITGAVAFSGLNYWDNSKCESISGETLCTGQVGLLDRYKVNGAGNGDNVNISYSSNPYPYVYESGNTIEPSLYEDTDEATDGGVYASNNGYIISYYVNQYLNKLKNEKGLTNLATGRLIKYEEVKSLENTIKSFSVDNSQCNIGGRQLAMSAYGMSEDDATNTAQALCNGATIDGVSLHSMLSNGDITSEYYSLLGISNVESFYNLLHDSMYWTGSAYSYYEVWAMSYDIEGEEDCYGYSFDRAKIYGVRPVIVVPTNELPN